MPISAVSASPIIALLNPSTSATTAALAGQASSPALAPASSGDAFTVDLSSFVQAKGTGDSTTASQALIKLKADITSEYNNVASMLPTSDGSSSGLGGLLSTMA